MRARSEAERLVTGLLGRRRLSLNDAITLRRELGQLVHRLVSDAQAGVEARLRALLSRGEEAAERSLEALRGRIEAYVEPPARSRAVARASARPAALAPRRRRARSRASHK